MRLRRLSLQAFRGYPDRVDILLAGDVVLIHGDNGAGKTSLAEGLEWALFGSIVRKEQSKTPGEYKGWSWLRSAHASLDTATFVEVELIDDHDLLHLVKRDIDGGRVRLTVDGESAKDIAGLGLRTEDAFRPFLGQCEIQGLIDSSQQERWEQLSAILGFGEFGRLRSKLQRLRSDTDHEPHVTRARDLATRAVQPLTEPGTDPLSLDPEDLRERSCRFLQVDEGSDWEAVLSTVRTQLDELHTKDRRPAGLEGLLPEIADLAAIAQQLRTATDGILAEVDAHRQWHLENAQVSFATLGLRLRNPEDPHLCPFCDDSTLTPERVTALEQIASAVRPTPADSRLQVRNALMALLRGVPANWDLMRSLLESLAPSPERTELEAALHDQETFGKLQDALSGLGEGFLAATDRARDPESDGSSLRSLAAQLTDGSTALAEVAASIRSRIESARTSLAEQLSSLTQEDRKQLAGLEKARALAENATWIRAAWRVRQLQIGLGTIIDELERIEKTRMVGALELLSDDIRSYYDQLSPGQQITFSGVTVRDSRYRQASLEAVSFGKPVNPVTTFSEAEGNCLGLSLYFSQRVDRNPAWRVIVLDDPVQSMDRGHEQGLINVLARICREGRQVIVMTHDNGFADLVEAQFRALASYTRYNLHRTSSPAPSIELHTGRLEELLDFVDKNAGGTQPMRESCAGTLRKAVERFTRDLASRHGTKIKKKATIEDAINQLHAAKLVDDIDVGTLHRMRRFGTRGAHDDPDVNAAEPAIRAGLRAIRELQEKHLTTKHPPLRLIAGGHVRQAETPRRGQG